MQKQTVRRGGRPSQSEAAQIRDQILDSATHLFLTEGYGKTSIEAIAKQIGISKRTFYHRFGNKADLFSAVVHRLIARLRPTDSGPLFEGKPLKKILLQLAKVILDAALMPEALALHRLIVSEATRFPELIVIMDAEGSKREALKHIADLFRQQKNINAIVSENPHFAAEQFLQMVISVPQQKALVLGVPMKPTERDTWIKNTVALFLHGCKPTL